MFEIKNVSRLFGQEFALKNISIEVKGGLNFIIGPSGSGKTTLLKILAGLDQDFTGEAYYNKQSLKAFTPKEKNEFYNQKLGIVWQEFNLIEDLSVFDNIKIPLYLNETISDELIIKIMKQLKINDLAKQKVRTLSGGQKQRVAIARELVKNPEVMIADEPTAALDPKSAAIIIDILKQIAKTRTVIIVTHDSSMLDSHSHIFEMDKGELVSETTGEQVKKITTKIIVKSELSLKSALSVSMTNMKRKMSRYAVLALAVLVSTSFLLLNVSGSIKEASQDGFEELYNKIGEGLLDINLASSFMSAAGSSGSEKEEKPNVDVNQDIQGLYDKYLKDERVKHVVLAQALGKIKVVVDGKEHQIETSNSVPVFKKLLTGKMPSGDGNEVVVSSSLADILGVANKDLIGKTIDLSGTIFNWSTGEPVEMPVSTSAKIVGVADTTAVVEYEGKVMEYAIDDSFFFSKSSILEMRKQADIESKEANFSMRANSPADMIALKDELLAMGIVPMGRFELVEDMVRLNDQAKEQSGSAVLVISNLALIVSIAISFMTAIMRKKEYAIYKINGFSNGNMTKITFVEYVFVGLAAMGLFAAASPLINKAMKSFSGSSILNVKTFAIEGGLVLLICILCGMVTSIFIPTINIFKSLKSGDR